MPTGSVCEGCKQCIPIGKEVSVFVNGRLVGEMHSHCEAATKRKYPTATFGPGVLVPRTKKKREEKPPTARPDLPGYGGAKGRNVLSYRAEDRTSR